MRKSSVNRVERSSQDYPNNSQNHQAHSGMYESTPINSGQHVADADYANPHTFDPQLFDRLVHHAVESGSTYAHSPSAGTFSNPSLSYSQTPTLAFSNAPFQPFIPSLAIQSASNVKSDRIPSQPPHHSNFQPSNYFDSEYLKYSDPRPLNYSNSHPLNYSDSHPSNYPDSHPLNYRDSHSSSHLNSHPSANSTFFNSNYQGPSGNSHPSMNSTAIPLRSTLYQPQQQAPSAPTPHFNDRSALNRTHQSQTFEPQQFSTPSLSFHHQPSPSHFNTQPPHPHAYSTDLEPKNRDNHASFTSPLPPGFTTLFPKTFTPPQSACPQFHVQNASSQVDRAASHGRPNPLPLQHHATHGLEHLDTLSLYAPTTTAPNYPMRVDGQLKATSCQKIDLTELLQSKSSSQSHSDASARQNEPASVVGALSESQAVRMMSIDRKSSSATLSSVSVPPRNDGASQRVRTANARKLLFSLPDAPQSTPIPPPEHSNPFPSVEYLNHDFTRECLDLIQRLEPQPAELNLQHGVFIFVERKVCQFFGGEAKVHQFGSVACGMCLTNSFDMDICVELPQQAIDTFQQQYDEFCLQKEQELALSSVVSDSELKTSQVLSDEVQFIPASTPLRHAPSSAANTNSKSRALLDEQCVGGVEVKQRFVKDNETLQLPNDDNTKSTSTNHLKRFRPPTLLQHILDLFAAYLEKDPDIDQLHVRNKTRVPIIKFRHNSFVVHSRPSHLLPATSSFLMVDVIFNNILAVHNTQLLKSYSLVDARLRQMVLIVKHWSRRRFINDTYSGTLSSYAYVLMIIHFMQCRCQPPILPNLQQIVDSTVDDCGVNTLKTDSGEFNIYFHKLIDATLLSQWHAQGAPLNTQSLGYLVGDFFRYFANVFDFKSHVIGVRVGGLLTKKEKNWVPVVMPKASRPSDEPETHVDGDVIIDRNDEVVAETKVRATSTTSNRRVKAAEGKSLPTQSVEKSPQTQSVEKSPQTQSVETSTDTTVDFSDDLAASKRIKLQRYWLCIEDPFEVTHNLGRPVGRDSLYFIRGEFLKAVSCLTNPRNYPAASTRSTPRHHLNTVASSSTMPKLLKEICQESPYKTRDEHKARNKENMTFSDRRKAYSQNQHGNNSNKSTRL